MDGTPMDLALAIDAALKCKSTEIDCLLNRYPKILDIDIVLVKIEMRMISTSLPPNFTFDDLSKLISKSLYPNLLCMIVSSYNGLHYIHIFLHFPKIICTCGG